MIYAEHEWKTNPKGEPLAKYFNEKQWSATTPVKRLVDGKFVTNHNSGWIATEAPTLVDPDPPPEPLKKTIPKKTTRKRKS